MIYRTDTGKLRCEIEKASLLIKKTKDPEIKFAMANRISNLYTAMSDMEDGIIIDSTKAFRTKRDYHRFLSRIDVYNTQMLENYILNKDFHTDYLGDILAIKENFETEEYSNPSIRHFSERDFCDILFQFLKGIHQEKLFDQIIRQRRIYNQRKSPTGNEGSVLYNPVTGKSDVFVREFEYTIPHMGTVAHELGHVYDFNELGKNPGRFNEYFYKSFYAEVISRLFEKLFIDYLITNNIEPETAREMLIRYDIENYFDQFNAFLLSTLSVKSHKKDKYLDFDEHSFYKQFKEYFASVEEAREHLEISGQIDLSETYNYSYGDIIATFLFDEFKKNGFYNRAFHDFMRNRFNGFSRKMFDDNNWTPKEFGKIYRKQLEKVRK